MEGRAWDLVSVLGWLFEATCLAHRVFLRHLVYMEWAHCSGSTDSASSSGISLFLGIYLATRRDFWLIRYPRFLASQRQISVPWFNLHITQLDIHIVTMHPSR